METDPSIIMQRIAIKARIDRFREGAEANFQSISG